MTLSLGHLFGMSYNNTHLAPGETIVFRTRRHWLYWLSWFPVALWGGIIMVMGEFNPPQILIGVALMMPFLVAFADYLSSEFVVTNRRVVGKVGILNTRSFELFLGRIEGLTIEQELFGRVFGYGTLVTSGTGASQSPFRFIAKPQEFRRAVNIQIEMRYTAPTPRPSALPPPLPYTKK